MSIFDAEIYVPGSGDGQPGNLTLPGSGLAVPAGVESVLEFNGVYLNIQKNVDRYRVSSIDGLQDADVRDTRDTNTADDGETPYNSFYGGRTIVISGSIQTYSVPKMRDMEQALRAAFANIRKESPLNFRTGDITKDHFINCKKTAPIAGVEQQQNFQASRDFQITLRASNPRFLSYLAKFVDVYPPNPVLQSRTYEIAVVQNAGNYSSQPVFKIFGPLTQGVTFINDATDEILTISGPIAIGDYLIFDTANRTLVNSIGRNSWNLLSDDSDYLTFSGASSTEDGYNHIFYYGDAPRIQIAWRDSWI